MSLPTTLEQRKPDAAESQDLADPAHHWQSADTRCVRCDHYREHREYHRRHEGLWRCFRCFPLGTAAP
jgi:hypothetical protein